MKFSFYFFCFVLSATACQTTKISSSSDGVKTIDNANPAGETPVRTDVELKALEKPAVDPIATPKPTGKPSLKRKHPVKK